MSLESIPAQVIMANRMGPQSLEVLTEQVTMLAHAMCGQAEYSTAQGTKSSNDRYILGTKVPKNTATSSPQRTLNTPFQVDLSNSSLVFYTIELVVQAPLLDTQTASVLLHCNDIPSAEATLTSGQLSGISLVSLQTTSRQMLTGWIPAGHTVNLVSSGSGSSSVISSLELIFS